jgi:hypothetical protein
MAVTVGGAARALTGPSPWSAGLFLIAGAVLLYVGAQIGGSANALFQRTEDVTATVDVSNRQLHFTTWDGVAVSAPIITDCRQRGRPPSNECIVPFQDGDKVLIAYDPEQPTRVWMGDTPGGGRAALFLALGIAAVVAGILLAWWSIIQPALMRMFSSTSRVLSQSRRDDSKR